MLFSLYLRAKAGWSSNAPSFFVLQPNGWQARAALGHPYTPAAIQP
jgi:hypothetical protein